MNWRFVFNLVGAVILFVAQLALIEALPLGNYLYLSLVVLVFLVVLFDLETTIIWFLINGFLLDLFSFRFFGFYTVLMLLILAIAYWLLNSVLTNRSLYAFLLLVGVAVALYDFGTYLAFGLSWKNFWLSEIKRLGINFLLAVVVFYVVTLLSRRLTPVFLFKNK